MVKKDNSKNIIGMVEERVEKLKTHKRNLEINKVSCGAALTFVVFESDDDEPLKFNEIYLGWKDNLLPKGDGSFIGDALNKLRIGDTRSLNDMEDLIRALYAGIQIVERR